MKKKSISKAQLVSKLGYRNIGKGLRRFDGFLAGSEYNPMIINNLHKALDLPEEKILRKLAKTRKVITREREIEKLKRQRLELKQFVPFLICRTERRIPSPIFVCAMLRSDRMKYVYLPKDITSMTPDERDRICCELIKQKMIKTEGKIPAFGFITHFVLKLSYFDNENERMVYAIDGSPLPDADDEMKKLHDGQPSLSVGGHDILSQLKVSLPFKI